MAETLNRQKKVTHDESHARDPKRKVKKSSGVSAADKKNSKERFGKALQQQEKRQEMLCVETEVGDPDSSFLKKENTSMLQGVDASAPELKLQILLTSQWVIGDVMDVVAKPIFMMTNLADAGVHGVATGIRALRE